MTIQRADPIPPGRYWIDALGTTALQQFDKWRDDHKATVTVEKLEAGKATDDPMEWGAHPGVDSGFYIFQVLNPTPRWPNVSKGLGLPNVAPASVQQKSDTIQRPPPEQTKSPLEAFADLLGDLEGMLVLGLFAYVLYNMRGKRR